MRTRILLFLHYAGAAALLCLAPGAWAWAGMPLDSGEHWLEIRIPMRDGAELAADFYAPKRERGTPKPVILIQTPYNKNFYREGVDIPQAAGGARFPYDSLHYYYVIVDWRGRFASRDAANPEAKRGEDGYDCVEWIAAQDWCNGKVGTWGLSALGQAQFETARFKPPHLVCCVPLVQDYKTEYEDYFYGGVFREEHADALQLLGFGSNTLILEHPRYDIYWKAAEIITDYTDSIAVPMLLIGGWYDHFPDGMLRAFHDMRSRSAPEVRGKHRLIYGPWTHSGINSAVQGELEYPNAATTATEAALRFFDFYLRGNANGWQNQPPVQFYQLGENAWKFGDDWYSLAQAQDTLFLRRDGMLGPEAETATEVSYSFVYNPADPSPSIGGARFTPLNPFTPVGPHDQRQVEERADALVFSTAVLERDIHVNGAIAVELFVASNRPDTDFSIRLCDVLPDGRSIILNDTIRRLRFRNSYETEEAAAAGETYRLIVTLPHIAATFLKGHRLRIIVSSSDYPRFHANPNTGGPLYSDETPLEALNTVYCDARYPSRVLLPVATATGIAGDARRAASVLSFLSAETRPDDIEVRFALSAERSLRLVLSDAQGKPVYSRESVRYPAGSHSLRIPRGTWAGGTYFCCLLAADARECRAVQLRF